MKLYISTGNSRMEKRWNNVEMELDEFIERISHTIRTAETVEQYGKMTKAKQDAIKDVGGYVGGKLKGGRRKKDCVEFRSALTLDMDHALQDIPEQVEMFFDFRCLIYSTHKHTAENPRLRLIIPLSRNVSPDEYVAIARKVAEDIGIEMFDDTTYEPSRLMYWPSTSADGEFIFRDIEGEPLDPDEVLSRYMVLVYKCGQEKLNNLYYQMKVKRRCSAWRKIKNLTLRNLNSRSWICIMPEEPRIHNWNVNIA
ncbi:hypothetical protein C819_03832 [Lachnospiraceae bacterium 10-1]|nr:hypothetical protein C819_03832 [Lachnospiraceae bacterium 10-1]